MNSVRYKNQIRFDVFKKITNMVTLKTAQLLRDNDPIMFQLTISSLCLPILEKYERYIKLSYILSDEQFLIFIDGSTIVFRYIDALDLDPFYIKSNDPLYGVNRPRYTTKMNSICWLLPNQSPITNLHPSLYQIIGNYLDVDDKRNMCLVSKLHRKEFSKSIHWNVFLPQFLEKNQLFDKYSAKQQVLRYMMYISSADTLIEILKNEHYIKYLAKIMKFGYFMAKKRKRTGLMHLLRVYVGNIIYNDCQSVIGYKSDRHTIIPSIWLDSMDNVRMDHDVITDIPIFVNEFINHYRKTLKV